MLVLSVLIFFMCQIPEIRGCAHTCVTKKPGSLALETRHSRFPLFLFNMQNANCVIQLQSKGFNYGFVEYDDPGAAERAMQTLNGRRVHQAVCIALI
jgi:hypothetical protein